MHIVAGPVSGHTAEDLVYFVATRDARGKFINGGTDYLPHIPATGGATSKVVDPIRLGRCGRRG